MLQFDLYYIFSTAKSGKEAELLALEQGEISVTDYENKFVSLYYFIDMFQTEEWKARMFERGLRPQIRRFVLTGCRL